MGRPQDRTASPMPHDGRCLNGGNLRTAQPNLCPMTADASTEGTSARHSQTYAPFPIPNLPNWQLSPHQTVTFINEFVIKSS
ncbi:hypothetical protein PI95_009665 [Hassallia byssoidea VB512170]|uniref:Uncharacterized protein n=1 Tax=Hassallia byssoidea VB512170 TaxID=1304833 RepID=A0A846H761_9CYAN|nr:hypothetical protein [Hassalia byssoidea]NEU72828.1 hypothetical protein [Hassalia byssoidea VB512170]